MSSYYEKFLATGEVKCIDEEIPFEIPQGWEWERWGNISQSIQYGYNAPALENGDIRMVRISDIQDNKVLWENVPFCLINTSEIETYLLKVNDILFARTGGTVGKSFLVEEVPVKAIYAGYLIRTRYSSLLCPYYMKAFMESQLYWEQLKNGTIATAQPNCNGKTLAKMLLPIPPINEQERIVEKLRNISLLIERYRKSQDSLNQLNEQVKEQLKKSILQEAIQGKLVPQISEEGTSQELLEQIKQEKQKLVKEGKLKKFVLTDSIIFKGNDKEKQKLVKEGKLKKFVLTDSIIFKGNDNKYYEQTNGQVAQIECDYDFPNNWAIARLSSICTLVDGEKKDGRQICLDAKYLRGKSTGDYLQKGRFVQKGDNIILVDGENSGEVFTVPCDGYMGSTFKQLWVSSVMYLPYVLNFILFYKELLRKSKRGAAIPHLNKEIFYSLIIGIPPYQEQVRIMNKINEIYNKIKG